MWMVCTFLPPRVAPGPPLGCHTGESWLKGFFLRDVCLPPTTHLRIFKGRMALRPRSLPQIPEYGRHAAGVGQSRGTCYSGWEPCPHWLPQFFSLIIPEKINPLLLKKYYFKNSWTLICLMLPCHRWCVSPDALAQDMGRRRLIFLCQASSAVTFVRGRLSDSHKTPDCVPRITYYGRAAHASICHQWFVCFREKWARNKSGRM